LTHIEKPNLKVCIPVASTLLASIVVSVVLWFFRKQPHPVLKIRKP
jgi:hypothetical protein